MRRTFSASFGAALVRSFAQRLGRARSSFGARLPISAASRSSSASRPSILRIRSAARSPKAITSASEPPYLRFNVSSRVTRCFELRELLRVEIEPFGVTIESARNLGQLDDRGGMSLRTFG